MFNFLGVFDNIWSEMDAFAKRMRVGITYLGYTSGQEKKPRRRNFLEMCNLSRSGLVEDERRLNSFQGVPVSSKTPCQHNNNEKQQATFLFWLEPDVVYQNEGYRKDQRQGCIMKASQNRRQPVLQVGRKA